jgi:hypothetical protein
MRLVAGWARLLALGRSTPVVLALIIAGNLVPLVGVLALGWSVAAVLLIYWVENGVVGVINVARMLLAEAPDPGVHSSRADLPGKVGQTTFFVFHYGIFWLVHGVFVTAITGLGGVAEFGLLAPFRAVLADPAILVSALSLLVAHGAAFYYDYVGKGEYRTASSLGQMWRPYPRLVVLHLTILLGGTLIITAGQPELLVVLLVVLKTFVELVIYIAERVRAARAPAQPELQTAD